MLGTTVTLAFRAIMRHKLRSFLTTLGIIIGVAAVVTMTTLGNGATAAVREQIASLGANILQLRPGQGFGRGGGGPRPPDFKPEDVTAIASQLTGVRAVAPMAQSSGTAIYEGNNWNTTVNGTTASYFEAQQWPLNSGRLFMPEEEQAGKPVCIIGNTLKNNLFRQADPLGQRFRIKGVSCQVIGVLGTRGQGGFGQDQDDVVVMPIKFVQRRFTGDRDISQIMVAVDDAYETSTVQASLEALMRERRKIKPGDSDNFNVFDTKQISDTLTGTTTILTQIVGAVAAISLLVGGIGIMNIMLVSVTERTREIGIRLAIGAVAREVLMQFLVEAVVLSCLGGLIGLVIALFASIAIAPLMQVPFIFDLKINMLAFLFSAAIGVVFGYFPARRAASLNPIDALRHE
ncbi:ABC transporter permease [Sphingosinicella microcystinivorans]|uniref:ABC transporter permease n=1 Tax=Sphingosinicella microcystinivorans TaxID=335406 RepID=UPI001C6CF1F2|nr:ABC transporter permease [Sphingosinicella microcystinivorans]MBW7945117.1 ABC transporter permease [Sphingomonadaceae bacterium]WBX85386.1 ABC transporter permease [Sphingosinicella microcystinivorans]